MGYTSQMIRTCKYLGEKLWKEKEKNILQDYI
jgi:hypothetical protein